MLTGVVLTCALMLPATVATNTGGEKRDEAELQEPQGGREYENKIRWTTASEVDNFGFDVFRATKESGPFECINPEPIPGAGTTDETTDYLHVDDSIDPRQEYYYYVESISMQGERRRFTPILRAPPKLPREGDDSRDGQPAEPEKTTGSE